MRKSDPKHASQAPLTNVELQMLTSEQRLHAIIQAHSTFIKISLMTTLATLLLVMILCVVVVVDKPKNRYFATTSDGRIVQLSALSQPLLSLQAVESFGSRAISGTFTFDYANYQKQITQNADSFTAKAFSEVKSALQDNNGLVTEAIKHNWVVTASVSSAPQVVKQGKIGGSGRYAWRLIYPVMFTFQNEQTTRSARYSADVIVTRMSQKNYPNGIAIQRLTLTPYRGA